jgi:hypothetical protein
MDFTFTTHFETRPEEVIMKINVLFAWLIGVCLLPGASTAQSTSTQQGSSEGVPRHHDADTGMNHMKMDHTGVDHADMGHQHGSAVPISYADLTKTAALLETARHATERYKDVRAAEADGYKAIGPDVPGMGTHFVGPHGGSSFDIERPTILLYEKDSSAADGYALVGVSYLLTAPEGVDGQPADPPFPKTLAQWHRHANICVLADRSAHTDMSESQCAAQGGHFTAETQWMVHAWIWKDSPTGVFAPTNPTVR